LQPNWPRHLASAGDDVKIARAKLMKVQESDARLVQTVSAQHEEMMK
jgi:hypothetical protein